MRDAETCRLDERLLHLRPWHPDPDDVGTLGQVRERRIRLEAADLGVARVHRVDVASVAMLPEVDEWPRAGARQVTRTADERDRPRGQEGREPGAHAETGTSWR